MAPPVLFVPGTLCDGRMFAPLVEAISCDSIMAEPISRADVASAADDVLAIAPPRFVACGFSLGGFVVLEIMRRAPRRLAGAILIASNAQTFPPHAADLRREEVALARDEGTAAVIDRLWPQYVARWRQPDADLRALIEAMAESVGLDRFAAQAELVISRPDSAATLANTQVPVLLITGDVDGMTTRERYAATAYHPLVRWIELKGVGHFPPLEAPDACAQAMSIWMEELDLCSWA